MSLSAVKSAPPLASRMATVDIKTLLEEHDRIDALSAEVVALADAAPDVATATATLATLVNVVTEHLRAEDVTIYPMLAATAPSLHLRDPAGAIANLDALREDWTEFLGEWTSDCIAADWAGFGDAARAMLVRLRTRVQWETSLLYPYALRLGVLRLRPAA